MRWKVLFALFLWAPLVGCGTSEVKLAVRQVAVVNAATSVFPYPATLVIRDEASWENLWGQMNANVSPAPPLPAVDFNRELVVLAATGTRPNEDYWVAIDGATESGAAVTVDVIMTSPGSDCAPWPIVTSRAYIASIPTTDKPVHFKVQHRVHFCGCDPFCEN